MALGVPTAARAAALPTFPLPEAAVRAPTRTFLQAEARSNAPRQAHPVPSGILCATAGCLRDARGPRGRLSPRTAWWGKPPPPPPPLWGRPAFWTGTVVVIAIVLILRQLSNRFRGAKGRQISKSQMYFELERAMMIKTPEELSRPSSASAGVSPGTAPSPSATVAPPAPAPMPSPPRAAVPPVTAAPAAAAAPAKAEQPAESAKPNEETLPEAVSPAMDATPAEKTSAEVALPPAEEQPVEHAKPAEETSAEAAPPAEEAKPARKKGAFAWLSRGQPKPKAPPLRELIAGGPATEGGLPEASAMLARAVASQFVIDAPDGCFQNLPGLTVVPASVPKAMRLTLLHTAVSSEAEKLKAVERADAVFRVGRSMFTELADRAAGLREQKDRIDALNNLVLLAKEASRMCVELAPDVEAEEVTYGGGMSDKQLEGLYNDFVDYTVEDAQASTMSMLGGLMGSEGNGGSVEQLQARAEESDELRQDLAKFFKIPKKKAEKLMEKRAEAMASKMQKEMMANLGSLSDMIGS